MVLPVTLSAFGGIFLAIKEAEFTRRSDFKVPAEIAQPQQLETLNHPFCLPPYLLSAFRTDFGRPAASKGGHPYY
ncbi:MAG: hypothetical protein JNL67_11520 [Planctomycetaceae bacterium]|nr:hypothetical protein [Planctomycetaceae bacterium]